MNNIQHFVDQQLGKSKWLSYDSGLHRLRCLRDEDFNQILPNDEGSSPSGDTPIFACKFAQKPGYENLLALANEEGELALLNTNKDEERIGKRAHHNAIFDLAWMYNEMKIVTVSGDHTARLLDVANDGLNIVQIFSGHTRSVKTVAFRKNDSWVFSTGSRDGSILVWDIRSNTAGSSVIPDNKIDNSHAIKRAITPKRRGAIPHIQTCVSGANSVTGMIFLDDNTLISCGAGDGIVKFWDLRKTYMFSKREPIPKHVIPYSGNTLRNGFSNLLLDEAGVRLYASCLDNYIYCYNVANYNTELVMKYNGHQNRTYYVKSCISRDGRYLLSGSSDHNAYIWNVDYPHPIAKLKGHNAEVTCVDWSAFDTTIVTCSDDMTHKIWRLGPEFLPENWEVIGSGITVPLKKPRCLKRILENLPESVKKRMKSCKTCVYETNARCENCNYNPKARKRLLLEHDDGDSKEMSPSCKLKRMNLGEPSGSEVSNSNAEVSSVRSAVSQSTISKCGLKRIMEEESINITRTQSNEDVKGGDMNKSIRKDTMESTREVRDASIKTMIEVIKDDLKENANGEARVGTSCSFSTPNAKRIRQGASEDAFSPTSNLPNFVIDGNAPHLNLSPQKKVDQDWLTKMSTEKRIRKRMQELTSNNELIDVSPKLAKIVKESKGDRFSKNFSKSDKVSKLELTPKSGQKNLRRSGRTLSTADSPKSPLLRFFKITNSSGTKEVQCLPSRSNVLNPNLEQV